MTNDELIEDLISDIKSLRFYQLPLAVATVHAIESLRAIVDRLPKTADGVSIVPGMKLRREIDSDTILEIETELCMRSRNAIPENTCALLGWSEWYSDEAAEAAKR